MTRLDMPRILFDKDAVKVSVHVFDEEHDEFTYWFNSLSEAMDFFDSRKDVYPKMTVMLHDIKVVTNTIARHGRVYGKFDFEVAE